MCLNENHIDEGEDIISTLKRKLTQSLNSVATLFPVEIIHWNTTNHRQVQFQEKHASVQ